MHASGAHLLTAQLNCACLRVQQASSTAGAGAWHESELAHGPSNCHHKSPLPLSWGNHGSLLHLPGPHCLPTLSHYGHLYFDAEEAVVKGHGKPW